MASSSGNSSTTTSSGTGSPCGACKFLRRKCAADCIFAPYFCSEQGPTKFAAIHKVFGASNISKLLLHLPPSHRCDAVVTITFEAQARLRDPVHGCVSHIFSLQHQVVAYLQAQLVQLKSQLANYSPPPPLHPPCYSNSYNFNPPLSPEGSPESVDYGADHLLQQMMMRCRDEALMMEHQQQNYSSSSSYAQSNPRKRPFESVELGDLQAMALGMMGTYN
ncbi:LOB domain-containing protein 16 [Linum perenne]